MEEQKFYDSEKILHYAQGENKLDKKNINSNQNKSVQNISIINTLININNNNIQLNPEKINKEEKENNPLFQENISQKEEDDNIFSIFNEDNFKTYIEPKNINNINDSKEKIINKELEDKIQKLAKKIKIELNNEYIEEIRIGFKSSEIGDYNYLNSLIQCLANLPDLLIFFKNNINLIKNIKKYPFTFTFFRLIENLKNNSPKSLKHNFNDFIAVVEHCFPFLKNNKNPVDLFNLIMSKLHEELNKENNKNKIDRKKVDQTDLNEIIKNEIIYFNHNNDTFVSKLFNIFLKIETKCLKCNKSFYEMQNFISFELDIIGTYQKYKKNTLTINDCLTYYSTPINKNLICSLCNRHSQLTVRKNIFSPSNNLVFVLSHNNPYEEKEMMKFKFYYEEILDITYYIDKKLVDIKTEYILIGVVAFSLDTKKFISFCRNIFDNIWMYYDEDKINECNYDYIVNNSNPYILFYKMLE